LKKIGITGGIGAGKSIVAGIIAVMGYPVYFSDIRAKELTLSDPEIRNGLIDLFGQEIYEHGSLNREKLAVIFQDDVLRLKVNELIHPVVRRDFESWVSSQHSSMVFNEAAILFETGSYKRMDATILVTAPEEIRLKRVVSRDNASAEAVISRMEKQWEDEQKIPLADFVIHNDDKTPVLAQVEEVISKLLT
jgi:dephospho-CoA kinase